MEKYIGPGIKINLEKGIEFYHVDLIFTRFTKMMEQ